MCVCLVFPVNCITMYFKRFIARNPVAVDQYDVSVKVFVRVNKSKLSSPPVEYIMLNDF